MDLPSRIPLSNRTRILLILAAGALNIAIMLSALWPYNIDGHLPPAQPDTLIYMQYGKAVAEGHPYRFHANDAPSTGSTSHVYPFLIGILYWLGADGDALATAIFILCAAFYLASLFVFDRITRILFPQCSLVALLFILVNSTLAANSLSMSEMALFTFVVSLIVLGFLKKKTIWVCVLLFLAPLIRPEGVFFAIALIAVAALRYVPTRFRNTSLPLSAPIAATAGTITLFAINVAITGHLQFDSVVNKGYFTDATFLSGFTQTTRDVLKMGEEFLLGTGPVYRTFVFMPLLGAGLVLVGAVVFPWKSNTRSAVFIWLFLCIGASAFMTAASGWQGVQNDRYFTWFLPYLYMFQAYGVYRLTERKPLALMGSSVIILVFNAVGTIYVSTYAMTLVANTAYTSEARVMNDQFEKPTSFVSTVVSGINYYLPDHYVYNNSGVTTRELNDFDGVASNLEHLKYNELFSDAKILTHTESSQWLDQLRTGRPLFSVPAVMTGTTLAVYDLHREALDRAKLPVDPRIQAVVASLGPPVRVDVGYPPDERAVEYRRFSRYRRLLFKPRAEVRALDGKVVADTGYTIVGYETMRLPATPGKDLIVVLRTASQMKSDILVPEGSDFRTVSMVSPLKLRFIVNGTVFDPAPMAISTDPQSFSEVLAVIPGELISQEEVDLTVGGDHISFCYWFYQAIGGKPDATHP